MIRVRAATTAEPVRVSTTGRTVLVQLVAWNTPETVSDDGGRTFYREQYLRSSILFDPDGEPVYAYDEHFTEPVGRVTEVTDTDVGAYATVVIADTVGGRELLGKVDPSVGIIDAVSIEFDDDPTPARAGELVTRTRARLTGLAFTRQPQHTSARVLAVRSHQPNPNPEGSTDMADDTTTDDHGDQADDETTTPPPAPTPAEQHTRSHRRAAPTPIPAGDSVAGARFRSFGHFVQAAARGDVEGDQLQRYYRALQQASTTDIAGLLPEQWLTDVIDLYRSRTPSVQAFRTATLPDSGMVVNQPKVTQRALVGEQSPEGEEVQTRKVTIGTASWDVQTFAGGQGMNLQTVLRSTPQYLNEVMRLHLQAMSENLNLVVAAAIEAAAAVGVSGNVALEYTTADVFDELIIDASGVFLNALGRPCEVVGMSVDLWKAVAKAKDADGRPLYPSVNPMNTHGTMSARSTEGTIIAVDWYVDRDLGGLGAGISGVAGVREAFVTHTGPTGTLTADVPSLLGRDVAVYQFAAFGAADASGLVQIVNAV
jgi:hypothetical protein